MRSRLGIYLAASGEVRCVVVNGPLATPEFPVVVPCASRLNRMLTVTTE